MLTVLKSRSVTLLEPSATVYQNSDCPILNLQKITCLRCVSGRFIKVVISHDTCGIVSPLTSSFLRLPIRHFPVLEFQTLHPGHLPAKSLQALKYKQDSKHAVLPLLTVVWTYRTWTGVLTLLPPLENRKLQTL